ncbi:MAG: DsbE family thiol:disulfide interchange protein [Proteobacteria bacterium]|nr:DsbE family thiol:disulfide interchange protein [Pseudomonadota bacterium]MCH8944979.1 DsbE family thiol:disulfide interchange protein [Pseudomonadota bacterium]
MNRFLLPLVAVVVFIPILILGLNTDPRKLPSPYIGKPAPQFELPGLKDPSITVTTASLEGRMTLVNIWATWCVGCRAEHQYLMQLAQQGTIPIYGINWRDSRTQALSWLEQLGDPYVVSGFDADARVGIDWGAYGAPESFLVNPQGIVLYRFAGPLNQAIWEREFQPRILEDAAP